MRSLKKAISIMIGDDLARDPQRQRGNRQRRIHPQRTRDQRSIGNVQSLVAEDAAVLVGDSFRRVLCHAATAQRVRHAKDRVAALIESKLMLLLVAELLGKRVESLLNMAVNRVFMEALAVCSIEAQRRVVILAEPELAKRLVPTDCRKTHNISAGDVF